MLHFAPPCATFSRARDRSSRTKLRSIDHPDGIPPIGEEVKNANQVAARTLALVEWVAQELKAAITIENPAGSYLWSWWETEVRVKSFRDLTLSQCRFWRQLP